RPPPGHRARDPVRVPAPARAQRGDRARPRRAPADHRADPRPRPNQVLVAGAGRARTGAAGRGRPAHRDDGAHRPGRRGAGRGGVKELAAMLNNADRGTERAILSSLEANDPELAEEVRALMFVFEDIVTLDDRAIQEVLRTVDARQLAVALKGVRADVNE